MKCNESDKLQQKKNCEISTNINFEQFFYPFLCQIDFHQYLLQ